MASPESRHSQNPYDRFNDRIIRTVDFGDYLLQLAREGAQILLDHIPTSDPQRKAHELRSSVAYATSLVLRNRRKLGFPNDPVELMNNPALEYLMESYIPDDLTRMNVSLGISLGFADEGLLDKEKVQERIYYFTH